MMERVQKIAEANLKLTERLVQVTEMQTEEWVSLNHSLRRIVALLEKLTGSTLPPEDEVTATGQHTTNGGRRPSPEDEA